MRLASVVAAAALLSAPILLAQSARAPRFDVVSIKRNTTGVAGSNLTERPDGGMTMINFPIQGLLNRVFGPAQVTSVPDWVRSEHYDIRTTSSLPTATSDDRKEMLHALLVERMGVAVHHEAHEQPIYELVFARNDHRLGQGLMPTDTDCGRIIAERAANPPADEHPDLTVAPSCTSRIIGSMMRDRQGDKQGKLGDLFEGEGTMDALASAFRPAAGRPVSNRAALAGTFRWRMNFDWGATRRPGVNAVPSGLPNVFDAIQEQLGLKLQPANGSLDVVVIDHIDRPAED
jgi:uncharacterized protein (TIGR03435 family)